MIEFSYHLNNVCLLFVLNVNVCCVFPSLCLLQDVCAEYAELGSYSK